jgi:hypothetical protein
MGSCAGRIFVLWLQSEPDMADALPGGAEMSDYDPSGDLHDTGDANPFATN